LKREKCSHFCGEWSLLGFIHKTVIALAFFSLYGTSGSQSSFLLRWFTP
jgi:hypothetical protein